MSLLPLLAAALGLLRGGRADGCGRADCLPDTYPDCDPGEEPGFCPKRVCPQMNPYGYESVDSFASRDENKNGNAGLLYPVRELERRLDFFKAVYSHIDNGGLRKLVDYLPHGDMHPLVQGWKFLDYDRYCPKRYIDKSYQGVDKVLQPCMANGGLPWLHETVENSQQCVEKIYKKLCHVAPTSLKHNDVDRKLLNTKSNARLPSAEVVEQAPAPHTTLNNYYARKGTGKLLLRLAKGNKLYATLNVGDKVVLHQKNEEGAISIHGKLTAKLAHDKVKVEIQPADGSEQEGNEWYESWFKLDNKYVLHRGDDFRWWWDYNAHEDEKQQFHGEFTAFKPCGKGCTCHGVLAMADLVARTDSSVPAFVYFLTNEWKVVDWENGARTTDDWGFGATWCAYHSCPIQPVYPFGEADDEEEAADGEEEADDAADDLFLRVSLQNCPKEGKEYPGWRHRNFNKSKCFPGKTWSTRARFDFGADLRFLDSAIHAEDATCDCYQAVCHGTAGTDKKQNEPLAASEYPDAGHRRRLERAEQNA